MRRIQKKNNNKGQALIETALVLILLLIILVGIAEFSRAWFVKNSLKNAARQGGRVAVVTPTPFSNLSFTCSSATINGCSTTPPSDPIVRAVCCQPGMPVGTAVSLSCKKVDGTDCTGGNCNTGCDGTGGVVKSGGTVKVTANYSKNDFFILGGGIWPWGKGISIVTDASFRYE